MTRFERFGYPAAVALGAVLIVITALNQPFGQNEWQQTAPYDSWDPRVVTSGTRQPPLDPLLGSWMQHLLGVGQLQQRLVPVLCGIASLALMAALLRRLRVGEAGVLALFVLASAPIFLRFSAYARPYALPELLMLACCYTGTRWLDDGRRRWLVATLVSAFLLPLARVPEPVVFLFAGALVLGVAGWRDVSARRRAWTLAGGLLAALVSVGTLALLALGRHASGGGGGDAVLDLNLGDAVHRLPTGLHELVFFVLPLYAAWFPWWPITLIVVLAAVAVPLARRRLLSTWYLLPLVLGPLLFLIAYHSTNAFPLVQREYRPRFTYFWAPVLTLALAVLGHSLGQLRFRWARWVGLGLVAAVLVGQLPRTAWVLTENDGVDVPEAAAVIERALPPDAVVLYDGPAKPGFWRQRFYGEQRFFSTDQHAAVVRVLSLADGTSHVQAQAGPIYLLILDSRCVYTIACDGPVVPWSHQVDGYRLVKNFGGFRLYAPTDGQTGREGAIEALIALAHAYPPAYAEADVAAAAQLLRSLGDPGRAKQVVAEHCRALGRTPGTAQWAACARG